jgi:predicted oxidoreductase
MMVSATRLAAGDRAPVRWASGGRSCHVEKAPHLGAQALAGGGEGDASRAAVDQFGSQLVLQRAHRCREGGLSRRHLSLALDASLRRLNAETMHLYQVHAWDPLTRLEESLRFLDDAVRAGKINYVGLSNFTGWQVQKAVDLADFRGLSVPVSMQPQYNLLARAVEWEIAPACEAAGLGLLAWSPLASGWLTGKYLGEPSPAGTWVVENADEGMRIWNQRGQSEQTRQVLDVVRKVAEGRGVSLAQVAIAWLMARPAVSRSGLSDILDGACSRAGFRPRLSVCTEQGPSALNLARAGLGLALVPGNIVPPHFDGILLRPDPPVRGSYTNHIPGTADGWRIERIIQHRSWEDGNTGAVAEAIARSQA